MATSSHSDAFIAGMAVRRTVHGAEHVDRAWAAAQADPFAAAMQSYVTEAAWGSIWSRPGIERSTRSLLVIATLIALNRAHELETHIRSAVVRNGCSRAEVQETVLQSAAYCGIPAAVDAFKLVTRIFAELDAVGEPLEEPVPSTGHVEASARATSGRQSGPAGADDTKP